MKLEYKTTNTDIGKTINQIIQEQFKFSARLLSKLIKTKNIYLNNEIVDTRKLPSQNDIITINFDYEEDNSNIIPTKMNLNIVYEDEWLLIINKPARNPYSSIFTPL